MEPYTKEQISEWGKTYNDSAKLWNSLAGGKLVWPQDKFKMSYCACRNRKRVGEMDGHPYCMGCGYYIIGE